MYLVTMFVTMRVELRRRMGPMTQTFVLEMSSPSLFVLAVIAVNVLGAGKESILTSEFRGASVLC